MTYDPSSNDATTHDLAPDPAHDPGLEADRAPAGPGPTHRFTYPGRAATVVTAAAAAALIAATSPPASADVPAWQHPSSDPTDNCVLLPDPGSSGDMLYPAGDDFATGVQDQVVRIDTLANDCANNNLGTTRAWATSAAVPPAQYAAGDYSDPIGQVQSSPGGVGFVPPPGFIGTVQFSYQTIEAGTETNSHWSGPYLDRRSSLATVTVTITRAPAPSSSSAAPSPVHTSRAPAPRPTRHPSTPPAPARAVARPAPQLASTGATPKGALGLGALLLAVGASAMAAGRRRRRPGVHRGRP